MPEFQLDYGSSEGAARFKALDSFTQGFIEAAFFTDTGYREDDDLEHASVGEIAVDALAAIAADCARWQERHAAPLALAYERGYTPEQAGRDYWFVRNGHGVGFLDRDELAEGGLAQTLTDLCRDKPVDMYRGDDELIYFAGLRTC